MPIADRTIKSLFAKSQNQCAIPDCNAPLVVGETVVGEICHIRARRKGGARYDATLTEAQKNTSANLVLLCRTCHTLVDKDKTGAFSVEWLESVKAHHERHGAIDLSATEARHALAILAKHNSKGKRSIKKADVNGGSRASAGSGGVAISIAGHNQGDIHVRMPPPRPSRDDRYPANSIGADANLSGYVDYLFELYVKYMSPIESNRDSLYGRLGKQLKTKFRLAKRTRNHLPTERFYSVVAFLQDKLAATPVGRAHVRRGTKFCSSFQEWRNTTR